MARGLKTAFKKWFSEQNCSIWGTDRPLYTTYRQKNFTPKECKNLGVRLDDYWWNATFIAFEAFKAGHFYTQEL